MKSDHYLIARPLLSRRILLLSCLCLWQAWAASTGQAQTVGEVLPTWSEGSLDIHQINTGKGNSALVIFPDATSLLIDAGATESIEPNTAPAWPNASRTPGEWITRYAGMSYLPGIRLNLTMS